MTDLDKKLTVLQFSGSMCKILYLWGFDATRLITHGCFPQFTWRKKWFH